jgi:hypothetical protein
MIRESFLLFMKYLSAILVFILAVMLQLWLAPGGIHGDFVLTALIVFAFLFEFWELAAFIIFGIFLLNLWPSFNLAMLMFVLVPLVVYVLCRRFSLDLWLGVAASIAGGIIVFYAVTAPLAAFSAAGPLILDLIACIIFGELVLCGMEG